MKVRAARLLLLCCLTALVAAAAASAGRSPSNPVCNGTKIDPVTTGTYALLFGSVTITVRQTAAGDVFDFDTGDPNNTIESIGVKGGPAFLSWTLNASSGTDLHAVTDPNSGKWYGLSYLCINLGGGGGIG